MQDVPPQDENLAHQLMNQAFACLDRSDLEGAGRIGDQLARMRHSGAFEIRAEIHSARGDREQAIATLEEGVRAAPSVWLLWQSLGNAYTVAGRHEQAQAAYGRALTCPSADISSIQFNRGMTFARDGRFEEALEAFDAVVTAPLAFQAATFKLAVGNDLHRFDWVVEQATTLLGQEARDPEERARIHAQLGRAYLQGYDDRDNARRHAEIALKAWPQEPAARGILMALERLGEAP